MHLAATFLWLPAATWALKISSPSKDTKWDTSNGQTVKFDSVSTDPKTANVVIVNQHTYPPISLVVGTNIDTTSGAYEIPVDKLTEMSSGDGYQVNIISTANDGILAQSGTFALEVANSPSAASNPEVSSTIGAAAADGTPSSHAEPSTTSTTSSDSEAAASSSTSASQSASETASSTTASSSASSTPNVGTMTLSTSAPAVACLMISALALLFN